MNILNINAKYCWCNDLITNIDYTRAKLIEKYGYNNLLQTSVYSSSGNTNALELRLYESLQHGKTFRIGVKGSYNHLYNFITQEITSIVL